MTSIINYFNSLFTTQHLLIEYKILYFIWRYSLFLSLSFSLSFSLFLTFSFSFSFSLSFFLSLFLSLTIHQFCTDTLCRLEYLLIETDGESHRNPCCNRALIIYIYIYIYIYKTPPMSVLYMTLNNLMESFPWCWSFGGIRNTPSLPFLPGPLWPGMVAPDRALFMG